MSVSQWGTSNEDNSCSCGGRYERSHTCDDYVVWECDKCNAQELEHFKDITDDTWDWLKDYYKK